jgi:hypothetical protein
MISTSDKTLALQMLAEVGRANLAADDPTLLVQVRKWLSGKTLDNWYLHLDPAEWMKLRQRAAGVEAELRQALAPAPPPGRRQDVFPHPPSQSINPLTNEIAGLTLEDIEQMPVEQYARLRQQLGVPEPSQHY